MLPIDVASTGQVCIRCVQGSVYAHTQRCRRPIAMDIAEPRFVSCSNRWQKWKTSTTVQASRSRFEYFNSRPLYAASCVEAKNSVRGPATFSVLVVQTRLPTSPTVSTMQNLNAYISVSSTMFASRQKPSLSLVSVVGRRRGTPAGPKLELILQPGEADANQPSASRRRYVGQI